MNTKLIYTNKDICDTVSDFAKEIQVKTTRAIIVLISFERWLSG